MKCKPCGANEFKKLDDNHVYCTDCGAITKHKAEPTEQELVHRYANRTIKNQIYHGRVDSKKFSGLDHSHSVSKNIWQDSDFYFSVVFQSSEQKYEFLKKTSWHAETSDQIQIVNGLKLAEMLGIVLKKETTKEYPTGNLDLMPFVLDNESIESEVITNGKKESES